MTEQENDHEYEELTLLHRNSAFSQKASVPAPVAASETLRQWKDELEQFVAQAQSRLGSLARVLQDHKTVAQSQQAANSGVLEANLITQQIDTIKHDVDVMLDTIEEIPQACDTVAKSPRELDDAQPFPNHHACPQGDPADVDPMDRIKAIKLRLAKQIQQS